MQGVHPAPNATPSGNAHARPGRARSSSGRRSTNSDGDPRRRAESTMRTPNAMMIDPEMRMPGCERRKLVIATVNRAPPDVTAFVIACAVGLGLTIVAFLQWCKRR